MPFSTSTEKIQSYLKQKAPFSIIDKGRSLLVTNSVLETTRYADRISGIVKDTDDSLQTVSLRTVTATELEASCSCSATEEMAEQWCAHAAALLLKASELDFFAHSAGFSPQESLQRSNVTSSQSIATLIRDLSNEATPSQLKAEFISPKVEIFIDCSTDRFGVQVFWDKKLQQPVLFEQLATHSKRALDGMLLDLLNDFGVWDEAEKLWYVNSSQEIEKVLGLIQEYDSVFEYKTKKKLNLSAHNLIDALLVLCWKERSLDLSMEWILEDGNRPCTEEIVGTGPLWALVNSTLYRLSPTATKIASLLPSNASSTLPRSQTGPIVEALSDLSKFVRVINPELQPRAEIKQPSIKVQLTVQNDNNDHFGAISSIELAASLDFEYPRANDAAKVVILPDREAERAAVTFLADAGFTRDSSSKRFLTSGDAALDIISKGKSSFPENWICEGLDEIKRQVKFSDLSLDVQFEESASEIDWFECKISLTQNRARIPLSTLFRQQRSEQDRWIQLDGGAFAQIPSGSLRSLKSHLTVIDPRYSLSKSIKSRLSRAQALSLSNWQGSGVLLTLSDKLKSLQKQLLSIDNIPQQKLSKKFHGSLRPYQHDGLRWLTFLDSLKAGGVLADEMGLGKTVQTLAFIQHLKDTGELKKPALVVAPTSVVTNWIYEGHKFTPALKFLLLHGPKRKDNFSLIKKHDVIVTSYALLRFDKIQLSNQQFSYVILDEAQNIKNPTTSTAQAAKALNAVNKIALSGTPTENRPLELWSIFDFLMPGYLGSIDFFKHHVERPILEHTGDSDATNFVVGKTKPFILRRTKAKVEKDLPAKTESVLHVPMTQSQRSIYTQILEEVRPKVFDAVTKKGVRGASISILAALLRLRQVCNHPNSIAGLTDVPGFDSGKFSLLQEIVTESLESGRKILLFSQFLEMLSIIRRWLEKKEINYLYLDGATKQRQSIIDEFNTSKDINLFLISLKAGGTGLNLASADTVIIYDPWWNPAVESQAVDRAHRIGQTKPVNVYRLVTEDSVEQKIMQLKDKKSKIVEALLGHGGLTSLKLTKSDIEALFAPPEQL